MEVKEYLPTFIKHLNRLPVKVQQKAFFALNKFKENPFNPSLNNHPLRGILDGARAISVTGDIRIIFEEENNYQAVRIIDIGTHNQVY